MIKRLFFAAAFLLCAATLAARPAEMLLTPDGTLHVVETWTASDHPEVVTESNSFLVLTTRRGEDITAPRVIPGSLTPGIHTNAALAYDEGSDRVFVLWQHSRTLQQSELVLASVDRDGNWSRTMTFADGKYRRDNLRIGVTRTIEVLQKDGPNTVVPELIVHAVWWEDEGKKQSARYAMLPIEAGSVVDLQVRELDSFVDIALDGIYPTEPEFNPEILRQPAIFEAADHASIEILFGNVTTNGFHRLRLKPVLDGRLRVPTGVKDRGFGAPNFRETTNGARIGALEAGDRIVLYFDKKNTMNYLTYNGKEWESLKSIVIDETITADRALSAIRQMLRDTE